GARGLGRYTTAGRTKGASKTAAREAGSGRRTVHPVVGCRPRVRQLPAPGAGDEDEQRPSPASFPLFRVR
ncbi:hypothetical protein CRG98_048913, partial [Punica granatum]